MNDCARRWRTEVASDMESTTSVLQQASHWWELLHSESASSTDHREFGEWVARSPERVEAYLQTARLVQAIKSPQLRWPSTAAEVLIREAKGSPEAVLPFSRRRAAAPLDQRVARHFHRFAWCTAAVLLIGIGLTLFMLETPQEFRTELGEQRSILLADGSRVTLNTASTIEVNLNKRRRWVRLVKGEALFEVAHDAARPFEVRTGNAVIRDVGTQFNIDMRSNGTTVTVVEGQVAVNSASANENAGGQTAHGGPELMSEALILGANDRIVITHSGIGVPQHGINAAAAVIWTQRELMFERRSLGEVAEEFNRYNRDRIDIDSAELERQEVTGVFRAKDPASFVAFLSSIPGVEIREGAGGAHIVTLRNQATHPEVRRGTQ
jgi:transmembrane sensor